MTDFQELPLVELSRDPDAVESDAASLDRALQRAGFCYLSGHGIPQELTEGVLAANRQFHAMPLAQKEAISINRWHRGYMGFASSLIVTSSVEKARKPNQSESFLMMQEVAADDPECLAGKPLQGPNQWPAGLPGFQETVTAYNAALCGLGRRLARTLAVALGAAPDALDPAFEKPTTFLRLLHYPPPANPAEADLYGSAPHTDYGFITLLLQDETGGLAVMNGADQWVPAPPRPGCFVMNVGDMAMRMSNGRWRSTRHRVINTAERDRYSAPFFFDMNMDWAVAPICTNGLEPIYPPVRYGDYLMERLDANYDYRREESHQTGPN